MERIMISMGGRELPMAFDLRAWVEDVEPRFGSLTAMTARLGSQDKPVTAGVDLIVLTINAGLRREGEKEKISREWVLDNLEPRDTAAAIRLAQMAVTASFANEVKDDEGDDVDEVLAEIEKKDAADA